MEHFTVGGFVVLHTVVILCQTDKQTISKEVGIFLARELAVSKDQVPGTLHVPLSVAPVRVQGAVDVMSAALQNL